MNRISKFIVLLGAVAPMAAFGVSPDQPAPSPTDKLQSLFADSVVVKGKGIEVKRNELDSEVVNTRAVLAAQRRQAPPDLEQQALKSLVIKQLVLNRATDADRAEGKKDFEDRIAKAKAENHWTDAEFDQRISRQLFGGQTRQQWEQENIDQLTVPTVLEREMGIKVTDDDARKFYDDPANIPLLEQPEKVNVSHILLTTSDLDTHQPLSEEKKAAKHKQMEDLLKRARAGEDFAKLADQYSEDPGVKENHGQYEFSRQDPFDEEFKTTAFSLTNKGQVSDIITSQFGYHIIKLNERTPAGKVDFDKVKEQIKDRLKGIAISKQLRTYMAKLEKDANLEILDDNLKGTDLLPAEQPSSANTSAPPPQGQK